VAVRPGLRGRRRAACECRALRGCAGSDRSGCRVTTGRRRAVRIGHPPAGLSRWEAGSRCVAHPPPAPLELPRGAPRGVSRNILERSSGWPPSR